MKICVISTWLPYWDGVTPYSAKLYREIAKYGQFEIVANKVKDHNLPQKQKQKSLNMNMESPIHVTDYGEKHVMVRRHYP